MGAEQPLRRGQQVCAVCTSGAREAVPLARTGVAGCGDETMNTASPISRAPAAVQHTAGNAFGVRCGDLSMHDFSTDTALRAVLRPCGTPVRQKYVLFFESHLFSNKHCVTIMRGVND